MLIPLRRHSQPVSFWGVHIGIAGSITALALYFVAPGFRYRWPVLAVSCGWAVIPDFHHVLDWAPTLQAHWRAAHMSAYADLFWFHRLIDRADPRDRPEYALVMWGVFFLVLVGTELAIRRRQQQHERDRE
jgi:predicted membrane channel-forming protein YqfA (hemolysin III family)